MSCVLSPGHGAHCALRLLLFHAYYSVLDQNVKEHYRFQNPSWCKIVDARTTYFIRLKDLPLHHLGKLAETI